MPSAPRTPCVRATSPHHRKLGAGYAALPQMAGRRFGCTCIWSTLTTEPAALRYSDHTPVPTPTGDYAPSLRSPWRAAVEEDIIAIDGKCLRRSIDKASNKAAIYMVSAWSRQNSLVLGQVKVDDKSNEITAIPKLLSRLDIAGAVITMDAMGCQKKIAKQIIQQEGDYVLSLKGNHGILHDDVETYFTSTLAPEVTVQTVDGDHGRIETRSVRVTDEIEWLKADHSWTGLTSIVAVTAKRELSGKVTEETRYFISSLSATNPKKLEHAVWAHWAIENNLHWV